MSKSGISTGIESLDKQIGGFNDSELIILGSYPSTGKTTLALSMVSDIAVQRKIPCGYFSLEMPSDQVVMSLLSPESGSDAPNLKKGLLTPSEFSKLSIDAQRLYDAPLFFEDNQSVTLKDIHSLSHKMISDHGVQVIFIDSINQIQKENDSISDKEHLSQTGKFLKDIAKELNIPVVALYQLDVSSDGNKPSLSQFKDSGSLVQDADVILLLHRENPTVKSKTAELIIAKQSNGQQTGSVEIDFLQEE